MQNRVEQKLAKYTGPFSRFRAHDGTTLGILGGVNENAIVYSPFKNQAVFHMHDAVSPTNSESQILLETTNNSGKSYRTTWTKQAGIDSSLSTGYFVGLEVREVLDTTG